MIWRDDDKRDEQQRKLEYARELEQQIELRKALEREEKQQQEEWERRFLVPRDATSPAKWWTELRASEPHPAVARLGFQMDASALPYANADPSIDLGALSITNLTPSRQRFHATLGDPLASHDRLREKAQQIEWKRLLDEQLREKERRQQQEAEEKRLREREEAEEEMRVQREQQLRAQRKLGIRDFTPTTAFTPENYVAIPSPPAPARSLGGPSVGDDNTYGARPPPAPAQAHVNDSVDFNFRHAMGLTDAPAQPLHESVRGSVADEYRSLLIEIRREREELRRERDELRREKEELRMERALMQMENEKMATLLESQRHMTDQRLESIARLDRALEAHVPSAASPVEPPATTPQYTRQQRTPRPTRLPSPLHVIHRDHSVQQLKNSIASLAVGRPPHQVSPVHNRRQPRQESRLGAMSMADFASPTNVRSPPTRGIDRFRFRFNEQENPLERSLNGESEFVALSPRPTRDTRQYSAAPRITETRSPVASMVDQRANPLRSSRVIKSRGFYDLNREDALPQQRTQPKPRTLADQHSPLQTRNGRETGPVDDMESSDDDLPLLGRTYRSGDADSGLFTETYSHVGRVLDHQDEKEEGEYSDDEVEDDEGASESHNGSELSRSLFQVQVLVKE